MPTQVQIRRAASGTQNARTLASGELDFDTTNKRLSVHDGSTVGGVKHANVIDIQNNKFTYVAAAGTNTITATFAPAPSARAKGQRWLIQAANTTTGAATFNPNGLGAGTIYKKNASTNTIIAIGANDILANGFYVLIDQDGSTGFELEYAVGGGLTTVKQGDLSTLTGSFSASTGTLVAYATSHNGIQYDQSGAVTLPGGEYGFHILSGQNSESNGNTAFWYPGRFNSATNAAVVHAAAISANTSSVTVKGQQRYVAACPPYDIGDGEMGGFPFLLMNPDGTIDATYVADDPPWANNGPTDIRPCRVCPRTGQEYIMQKKLPTWQEALEGKEAEVVEVPLTQKIKNTDMKVIPHPFGNLKPGQTVVLLDPMDDRVRRILKHQNDGGDIWEFLDRVKPDNEQLKRKQIKGVMQVGFKM